MKRFTFPLFASFLLLSATSCVREYTCQCTIKYTGQAGLPDSSRREYPIRDARSKARDICQGNSVAPTTSGGITTTETCDLY
ncbi:MAG: hypothetical protein EOP52_11215 [Sphingobacteriales bacterium]|nr:MAG: hypothetical protein EOP52_11215 [Sphingobacteriales bacterium]